MATRKTIKGVLVNTLADGTKTYAAHVRVTGFEPVYETFLTLDRATAWAEAEKKRLREMRKGSRPVRADIGNVTLSQLNAAYLASPAAKALADLKDRTRQLAWWDEQFGTVNIRRFGRVEISEATELLLEGKSRRAAGRSKAGIGEPRSPSTVNNYLAAQSAAWAWAQTKPHQFGIEDRAWPKHGVRFKGVKPRTRHLSVAELNALFAAAAKITMNGKPTAVMTHAITLALTCGPRASELFDLTWGDLLFDGEGVQFLDTKNGEDRGGHLPEAAREAFRALKPENPDPAAHVFVDPDGQWLTAARAHSQWKKIRKKAGLKDFRWHDLRHSCASFLAARGASLVEIGSVLGHRDPRSTARYTHMVRQKEVTGHAAMAAMVAESALRANAAAMPPAVAAEEAQQADA